MLSKLLRDFRFYFTYTNRGIDYCSYNLFLLI